jgi:predicted nucleic acid-binding protein
LALQGGGGVASSGWLLDTNVVSAFAPGRPAVSPAVAARFEAETDNLFLCAITVTEIVAGIAKLRRTGAGARAARLQPWFEQILDVYADRVLPFDLPAARAAGELADATLSRGHTPGLADAAIGAIAQTRGLTVLTANLRRFEALRVSALDPFATFDAR